MLIPEVQEKIKSACGGNVKHVVLFGIEVIALQISAIFRDVK